MSRCTHRDRRGYSFVDFCQADGTLAGPGHRLFRGRCQRCGDISLGPANDAGVEVEIRAAELAQSSKGVAARLRVWGEWVGWCSHREKITPVNDEQQAGWLAREIATHTETDHGA